jgi:hypothetical protein
LLARNAPLKNLVTGFYMVRMDDCQNYPLDVLHFISRTSNMGLKLRKL